MDKLIDKCECTGCGACELSCKANAIHVEKDILGYPCPVIDSGKCVDCGACVRACHKKTAAMLESPKKAYAFQTMNESLLRKCGSGGFFSELAAYTIQNDGIVFGVSMEIAGSKADLKYLKITDLQQLGSIQGSKYAISDSKNVYAEVESSLMTGRKVLFSGTPCQVAGLKGYLKKNYENLLTVDVFCHGNSPLEIFNKYLDYMSDKYHSEVTDYDFRDKEKGKGFRPKLNFSNGKSRSLYTYQEGYWYLCQFSKINLEACYECPYSTDKRCGDVSIGDYWGIENVRPDLYASFNGKYGINAVFANTDRGVMAFDSAIKNRDDLIVKESTIDDVKKHGAALKKPNAKPGDYEAVHELLENKPFSAMVKYSKTQLGLRYYKSILIDLLIENRSKSNKNS